METIIEMSDLILKAAPILLAAIIYVIRLEKKLSQICTEIQWIKMALE